MAKHCPFMLIARAIGETAGGTGIGGYHVSVDTACGEESCPIWNEAQNKCGLVCTSQPEQPSRDMESVFNLNGLRQMTFKESRTKDCPQLVVFTKGAKTQISSSTYGKEWATYCKRSDME